MKGQMQMMVRDQLVLPNIGLAFVEETSDGPKMKSADRFHVVPPCSSCSTARAVPKALMRLISCGERGCSVTFGTAYSYS